MATERKLGRTASQRKAMLRNLATNLLWYGRIETTEAKAKEVRSIVDKLITLAIREYDQTVEVEKQFYNEKKQKDVYMVALRNADGELIGYYEKHESRRRDDMPMYGMHASGS